MRRAGADYVFAPYNTTGHRMAQALLRPHVQQFIEFTTRQNMGWNVGIEQVLIAENSSCIGRTLAEVPIKSETGVTVLAIRKGSGEMSFNPPAEARIDGGDHLIAMGEQQGLRKLEQLLEGWRS
jgi:voltage-gated potassium channel